MDIGAIEVLQVLLFLLLLLLTTRVTIGEGYAPGSLACFVRHSHLLKPRQGIILTGNSLN